MAQGRLSHRAFGLVFAGVFSLVGGLIWLASRRLVPGPFAVAGVLALVALVAPAWLWPLNRFWSGVVQPRIAAVVNGLVLRVMFYLVLTPFALLLRLFRRDILGLRLDPSRASYFEAVPRQTTATTLLDPF